MEGQMDQAPQRHRHPNRTRRVLLGVLWLALLLAAVRYGKTAVVGDAVIAVGRRLRDSVWAWALAAAVFITVLTGPRARRWWPQPTRRLLLGLIALVGLYGLTTLGWRAGLLVLSLVAVVGLLVAWILVLPRRLAPPLPAKMLDTLEDRDRLELNDARVKLQNDLRTTALQAIAGLAVLAGAVLAFQQLTADREQANATRELTLQGQASERFTRAIDQLGSDRLEVQLGGIYGLEQIAQQAPNNRVPVTEVLVAFLHRRSPRPANPTTQPAEELRIRAPEVQAALTVLVRRRPGPTDPSMDLSGLDLRGARLSGAFVPVGSSYDFRSGDLRRADLRGTDLRGARFDSVDFGSAYLDGADLRGADLDDADFYVNPTSSGSTSGGLKSATLRGALADTSTSWPSGFDWRAEGVKME
jgi:hypothetical protein